ncbi:monovalent cation/H+ antiporter subunit E [Salinirussus salinus]|uniref:monovalent cation/H+ antiporter subunit E n=1 Tax=Salinirussus salinus TaxID=1198300 RepID=UPI00135BA9FD|nr:monovalent cation/H+ antiporter subunit E [Salinirussus salinus]
MSGGEIRRTLVPVGDSETLRNTVAYVVREAVEAAEDGARPVVHFVYPAGWRSQNLDADPAEEAEALLDRVQAWVREDLGADDLQGESLPVSVTAEVIALDEYLFSPRDYAEVLLSYAEEHGLDHIVLDPEYQPDARAPLLSPLEAELDLTEWVTWEEAPVERGIRGRQLLRATAGTRAFLAVFGLSFLFYQVLGGFAGTFDYVTGAFSAALVAAVLSGITFTRDLRPVSALLTGARWLVYIPYLFWEIAKANVQIVYIILHPSLPIDPSMERFRPAVPVGLPVTSLANSITLTPGTVTVEAREGEFYVHALTESSREALYDGGLERAIRFVFFGRGAARFPSPRQRGQTAEREGTDGDGAEGANGPGEGEPQVSGPAADAGSGENEEDDTT